MRPLHRHTSAAVLLGLLAALCLSGACRAQAPPARPAKPTLYVLAIGVSLYKDSSNNLQFPAKDAADIAARFQAQEGKLFGRVVVTTLTDKAATREGIIHSLVALRRHAPEIGPDDCTILYLNGHAIIDDLGQYVFAPYDFDTDSSDVTGVPWISLSATLATLPGHVLLLLDTSHAGGVEGKIDKKDGYGRSLVATPLARFNNESPLITFAACARGEQTEESADWKQGSFAKALLEALSGAADENHDGRVTLMEVARYVARRAAALTRSAQNPVLAAPAAFPADLPLAVVAPAPTPGGPPPPAAPPAK